MTNAFSTWRAAGCISRTVAASKCRSTTTERRTGVVLSAIDLIVGLCFVAQFAIAGYFFYLLYWVMSLGGQEERFPALPDDLPTVLVQIPVFNEPAVVERAVVAAA